MQFVPNGPDIPDVLLQAHEDGQIVFFCGAGISYPAGLPGFRKLVDDIYEKLGTAPNPIEQEAYNREMYDATLGLLEQRIPGHRIEVRQALAEILKPNLRLKNAKKVHLSLLQLAKDHKGSMRLVTTNFDRIFHHLTTRSAPSIYAYPAPLLPIPKNSRWNGLVYLHGLLPDPVEESALNRLVLTSGDFGLAYLTERWAARFVSELFRNYSVCFVGYSINDPVMRYVMDALAADRMLGESTPLAYALGSCHPGQEEEKRREWKAKGVIPILYHVPTRNPGDHSFLYNTLEKWASTYRDGISGREQMVVDYAMAKPSESTKQDDYVGRMLWALSHSSGLPAKLFSELNPVPSLDWLESLHKDCFGHLDLFRFGVPPKAEIDEKLQFSLLHRPAPYSEAPLMMLVVKGMEVSAWDRVMVFLAAWLVRHLNNPELVLWIAKQGGKLHPQFIWIIEHQLNRIAKLEREGNTDEIERLSANAPDAIPHLLMRKLWQLIITGRIKSSRNDNRLFDWKRRFTRDGMTAMLRMQLRELLAPKIKLKRPFKWPKEEPEETEITRITQLVDWELVLTGDHVNHWFKDFQKSDTWQAALPELFNDFQHLLLDAFDLQAELGAADSLSDRSYWDLPSIIPHWQNRGFHDWVSLIELLRDSWSEIQKVNVKRSAGLARAWASMPYPTFKRLAFFAASHNGCIMPKEWVDWLLSDNHWWLWTSDTKRETMRLLVSQGQYLTQKDQKRLESAILLGPPRKMYNENVDPDGWKELQEELIWLRLAKLTSGGCNLGSGASRKLTELSAKNPKWRLDENQRDEFAHWTSGSDDPDYENRIQLDRAPRARRDLIEWLKKKGEEGFYYKNDWREVCKETFPTAVTALCALDKNKIWPLKHWREALQTWSEEDLAQRSWKYVVPIIIRMPDELLLELSHTISWWIKAISKGLKLHNDIFLSLCQRLLTIDYKDEVLEDQPVSHAINHPVGHVTEALLSYLFSQKPNDNEGLPDNIKDLFTMICQKQVEQFRHGRVILASRVIPLFRVDRFWTEEYLLQFFNWQQSGSDARAAWKGFLWSPRLYWPLLLAFKTDFLNCAHHYRELDDHAGQYAALLTYAALHNTDIFTTAELRKATEGLPQDGLQEAAQSLVHALEGAGERREQYWRNRILPYWKNIWPKSQELISKPIAEQLVRLAIAAQDQFPIVMETVLPWVVPLEDPDYIVYLLNESKLCSKFPQDALRLLAVIINDQHWPPSKLDVCMNEIAQKWPAVNQDDGYKRLMEYQRRRQP